MTTHDLIVVGAGQGGGPLAGAFARAGRKVALIERAFVGGTCVNVGCTPTKTLIGSARVAHLARRAVHYGVHVGNVSVDMARVRQRKRSVVESFRTGSERSLDRAGVEVIHASARFVAPRSIEIVANNGAASRVLAADRIVIDTGTRPRVPPIAGLRDVSFLDSTSIMELSSVPEHLIVLGGGAIGLEFAQMFRRFGSRVSIVQRAMQLLPREDGDIVSEVANIFALEGIDVILHAQTSRVTTPSGGGVQLDYAVGSHAAARTESLSGSHLLVATGRTPNTDELNLEAAGVAVDGRGYIVVNERLETSAPGIFALGDVAGQPQFTHVSYDDFRILRANLLESGQASIAGRVYPYTIYIDPQLGRIGLTEREARDAGYDVRIATLPMAHVARAIEVDETTGVIKAVVDAKTERILGAAVLGAEGGELASLIQVAMMGNLPYTALRDGMFAHPTLAESMNNLFRRLT